MQENKNITLLISVNNLFGLQIPGGRTITYLKIFSRQSLYLLLTAASFGYYIVTSKILFYTNKDYIIELLFSSYFYLAWIFLTLIFFILLYLLVKMTKIECNEDLSINARILMVAVIFLIIFIPPLFKYNSIVYIGIKNLLFAVIVILLLQYTGVFNNSYIKNSNDKPTTVIPYIIIVVLALFAMSAIRTISFHDAFKTNALDMGVFTNLIWRAANGFSMFNSIENNNHFTIHFQPIIFAFAPFFKIVCNGKILLLLQSMFLFTGLLFVYLFAKSILKKANAAFFITLGMGISPYFIRVIHYDFHFTFLYVLCVFAFLYFAETKKYIMASVFLIVGLLTKEECGIYFGFISLYLFLIRNNKTFIVFSAVSFLYSIIVILLIMPYFSNGEITFLHWLDGMSDLAKSFSPERLGQLFLFLAGLVFLPFLSLKILGLLFLPAILVHMFHFTPVLFDLQYSAFTISSGFIAAIYSINILQKKDKMNNLSIIALLILIFQVQLHFAFNPEKNSYFLFLFILLLTTVQIFIVTNKKIAVRYLLVMYIILTIFVFWRGYFSIWKSRSDITKSEKEAITKTIDLVTKDTKVPVYTNQNYVPHVACREHTDILNTDTIERITNSVISNGFKIVCILYKKEEHTDEHDSAPNDILKLKLENLGYKEEISINNNKLILAYYHKKL